MTTAGIDYPVIGTFGTFRPSRTIDLFDNFRYHVRLSDIEPGFACSACGNRGDEVRPDFDWVSPRTDRAKSLT